MDYRAMQLDCYCGQAPERILEVGFTSDRNLVVHFWCSSCSRVLFISRPIDECTTACTASSAKANIHSADDVRFLQSLGIATPE
jgi:hypothetical protein